MPSACKGIVIVVDDDSGIRDSVGALLSAKGYAARCFDSAERFLEANNIEEEAVILMDYSLGKVSGLDAIRRVRADGDRRPIIMITAHGDIELAVEAMRAGASDFMEKPWDQQAFFQAIERTTSNARSAAKLAARQRQAAETIASFTERETDVFEHLIRGGGQQAHRARTGYQSPDG